jgi:hypothetical protein
MPTQTQLTIQELMTEAAKQLLPASVLKELPALYSQDENPDPQSVVKFFTPWAGWTWYATEGSYVNEDGNYDDENGNLITVDQAHDFMFYGLVDGFEKEHGYFTVRELMESQGPAGLKIERDIHWKPKPLSELE